ncbi:MAG: S41 family peptidase [Bacteroidales bacterium]
MNYKFILLFLFILTAHLVTAQDNKYLWFFEKGFAESDILYKPQEYIGQEKNFDNLIISAPLETKIQSPTNGTISFFQYSYLNSLNSSVVYERMPTNYKTDSLYFAEQSINDVKFISLLIAIKTDDGKVVHIRGLRPTKSFKTGDKIKIGDIIGKVGYFYSKINKPTICFSVSENGKPIDPMSPFGLKSGFVGNNRVKNVTFLSKEEANTDFDVFISALKEIMPDIYDFISESEFERFIISAKEELSTQVHIRDFERIIINSINLIRDSHLYLLSPRYSNKDSFTTPISIGWLNDSLIVTRTSPLYLKYYKRKIAEVDGISADSLKKIIKTYINPTDGYVVSNPEFVLLTYGYLKYCQYKQDGSSNYSLNIKFDDGEVKYFEGVKISPNSCVPLLPSWKEYALINRYQKNYLIDSLDKQTAYIGLSTFDLNEVETDAIENFIREISKKQTPNLIIDLRNNSGGDVKVLSKLFSFIAQEPFYHESYSKVNKKGEYEFFKYCTNYNNDATLLFPDYHKIHNRDGFYKYNKDEIQPDKATNYKGRVYVLTNENSFSASTNFAGLVKKYRRGVVVGRETGSTYHQLKAVKFADLKLPNSNIDVRIPMVKTVFDTIVNDAFPWGRGVLPDYDVNISLKELSFENGDSVLNYTKKLISENKYILEQKDKNSETFLNTDNYLKYTISIVALLLIVVLIVIFRKRFSTIK